MGDLTGSYLDLLLDEMAQGSVEMEHSDCQNQEMNGGTETDEPVAQNLSLCGPRSGCYNGEADASPAADAFTLLDSGTDHCDDPSAERCFGMDARQGTPLVEESPVCEEARGSVGRAPADIDVDPESTLKLRSRFSACEVGDDVKVETIKVVRRETSESLRRGIPEGAVWPEAAPEVLEILLKLKRLHCHPDQRQEAFSDAKPESGDDEGPPTILSSRELDQEGELVLDRYYDDGDDQDGRISPFLLSDSSHRLPVGGEEAVMEEDVILYDHYKSSVSTKDLVQLMEAPRESLYLSSELSSVLRQSVRSALHSRGAEDIKVVMREQDTREEYVKSVRRSIRLAQVDLESVAAEVAEAAKPSGDVQSDEEGKKEGLKESSDKKTTEIPSKSGQTLQVPSAVPVAPTTRESIPLSEALAVVEGETLPSEEGVSLNNSGTAVIEEEISHFTELSSSTVSLNDIQSVRHSRRDADCVCVCVCVCECVSVSVSVCGV